MISTTQKRDMALIAVIPFSSVFRIPLNTLKIKQTQEILFILLPDKQYFPSISYHTWPRNAKPRKI